jgi:hypothetical protein
MRKVSVYFASLFMLVVMGCGGTSGDPTARITALKAEPADVTPGGSSVITATVIKATGTATTATTGTTTTTTSSGWGENVTFTLLTANGARLSSLTQKTDGAGTATTVYTAGNNYSQDVIQATLDNGMAASIVIKKTGSVVGTRISSLTASFTEVVAGQTSVVTAKVTDGNDKPMKDETVTFTLSVNNSGASFVNPSGVYVSSIEVNTDAGGNAVALYYAGSVSPTDTVYDTVWASLSNGSTNPVVIKRSAEVVTSPVTPLSIAVAASPVSVSAGQVSIVTATLTGDGNVGVTVIFSLPINNSGATLSSTSAVSDGAGNAVVIYQPGANNPTLSVQDTVQAAVGSASNAAAITRTASATAAYSITVSALPATLTADNSSSVITANVKNSAGTLVSGVTVTFTVSAAGGTVTPGTATTNGSGNAVITFTGGPGARLTGETDIVTASTTIGGNTYTGAVVITYP